jgi:hypothetical protein
MIRTNEDGNQSMIRMMVRVTDGDPADEDDGLVQDLQTSLTEAVGKGGGRGLRLADVSPRLVAMAQGAEGELFMPGVEHDTFDWRVSWLGRITESWGQCIQENCEMWAWLYANHSWRGDHESRQAWFHPSPLLADYDTLTRRIH